MSLLPRARRPAAFTLVEMLIVISIISVLLGLLYGSLERAQKYSRRTITYTELKSIESAFKQYYAHYHAWPSNGVVNAAARLSGGAADGDLGFVIDGDVAHALQGLRNTSTETWKLNPEGIPFIEFTRFSAATLAPVNPFKSDRAANAADTSRSYKVLFDTNGDRQILVPADTTDAPGTPTPTNVIASVVVWTAIPATRKTDDSGQPENTADVRFGSWDAFSAK